jgi:hypothetical protein
VDSKRKFDYLLNHLLNRLFDGYQRLDSLHVR